MARLLRRLVFAFVYTYCILLVYRLQDRSEVENIDEEILWRLRSRNQRVRKKCLNSPPPLSTHKKNAQLARSVDEKLVHHFQEMDLKEVSKHLLYQQKFQLTWCLVPKVASTSWSRALLQLDGYTEKKLQNLDQPPQVFLREVYRPLSPSILNKTISSSLKYVFVRHPFQRLVSAFRNKLEDSEKEEDGTYFYMNYGRRIVEQFRIPIKAKINLETNNDVGVPEEEFRKEPTFEEFIDYIIETDINAFDEHWKPIWLQCNICDFNFDFIVKYEKFNEEIREFIKYMQAKNKFPKKFHLEWKNKKNTNDEITKQYMQKISQEKLLQVYQKYKEDFDFFYYDLPAFL